MFVVVATFDLVHDVGGYISPSLSTTASGNLFLNTSDARETAISRASFKFQKRFPDAVNSLHRPCMASTSCSRSHVATTKQQKVI